MLLPYYIATLFGLAFGSFLNVCIARLPVDASIVHPRSQCPLCRHTISTRDNVPILSWLLLRRRCRHCHGPISVQYPLVELATAAWFALSLWRFDLSLAAVNCAALGFFLIGLLVMDWQTQLLPDEFTLGGAAAGFALASVRAFLLPMDRGEVVLTGPERVLVYRTLAILIAALLLLIVRWGYRALRKRDGMGLGDVKMLAMIAAFLGLRQALLALFFAVIAAGLYAVALLLGRKATGQTRLPFGSFLAVGGMAAALFGIPLIAWYSGFYR
ncbi:MAG TPA: prepilin peptidase [Acidobacteriaceae bacterium]|jgi:leader peptidase (prepilin peptidase)/N-methyltransferase|nr:prepilin peptidase [Acidobacteriaceae bacterium]